MRDRDGGGRGCERGVFWEWGGLLELGKDVNFLGSCVCAMDAGQGDVCLLPRGRASMLEMDNNVLQLTSRPLWCN